MMVIGGVRILVLAETMQHYMCSCAYTHNNIWKMITNYFFFCHLRNRQLYYLIKHILKNYVYPVKMVSSGQHFSLL